LFAATLATGLAPAALHVICRSLGHLRESSTLTVSETAALICLFSTAARFSASASSIRLSTDGAIPDGLCHGGFLDPRDPRLWFGDPILDANTFQQPTSSRQRLA
jgi:hypothetical protein